MTERKPTLSTATPAEIAAAWELINQERERKARLRQHLERLPRKCKYCKGEFFGREDKLFCSSKCRSTSYIKDWTDKYKALEAENEALKIVNKKLLSSIETLQKENERLR